MKNIITCIIVAVAALYLIACDQDRAVKKKLSSFTGFNTEILWMHTLHDGTTMYRVEWKKYDDTTCHAVIEEYGERYSYTAQPKCE